MKSHPKRSMVYKRKVIPAMIAACGLAASLTGPGLAELADLADVPLANSPSDAVLPNLMYILDDSGSMMWDYMPDNIYSGPGAGGGTRNNCKTLTSCGTAGCTVNVAATPCMDGSTPSDWGEAPYYSAQFNQVYYNPDIEYTAGVNSSGITLGNIDPAAAYLDAYLNTSTRNLKTNTRDIYYCTVPSPSTSQFNDSAICRRNGINNIPAAPNNYFLYWKNDVANGGYPAGSSTGNGFQYRVVRNTGNPYYFRIAAHEYCSDENLVNCALANADGSAPTGFTFPAPVRYCASTTDAASTAAVSGNDQATVSVAASAGATTISVASQSGFTAGEQITVPLDDGTQFQATISSAGTTSLSLATSIPAGRSIAVNASVVNSSPKCRKTFGVGTFIYPRLGRFTRVDITSSTATYAKSATAVRPDCGAGTTCTYAQELQNYANWFSYYRTRMAMMKTATGLAFRTIDDRYRVGFITINPSVSGVVTTTRYLPIGTFGTTQKDNFYTLLYSQTDHGSTPLRLALSRVGRHFAGVTTGINDGMSADPMQYSCQQNFALLTTDGYWNDSGTVAVDTAGVAVGNQDNVPTSGTPVYVSRPTGTLDGTGVIQTTGTPFLERERVICTGSGTITNWTTGGNSGSNTTACGCSSGQKSVWERRRELSFNVTLTDGTQTSATTNVTSISFTQITPCDSNVEQTTRNVTETIHQICLSNNSTTFGSLVSGVTSGGQTSCACGGNRRRIFKRDRVLQIVSTVTDGVTGSSTTSTVGITFTNVTPLSNPAGNVNGCTSGSLTAALATFSNTTSSTSTVSSNGGTTVSNANPAPALATNPTTTAAGGQTVTTTFAGSPNTLADVAMYYYKTDLRTTGALAPNNVPTNDKDVASHQHMVTFTLGLGLTGLMNYRSDYETATTGDFARIKNADTTCSWLPAGQTCNWPIPSSSSPTTLDDLWHAAVNGRGTYYSAADPNSLADGLSGALSALKIQTAAASASATSSPNITETDNFIYSSTFRTVKWDGQITAQRIDTNTGNVLPAVVWEAQGLLNAKTTALSDTRSIWKFGASATGAANTNLVPFLWGNLSGNTASSVCSTSTERGCFQAKGANLNQYSLMDAATRALADNGENMVNWLRGQTRWEGSLLAVERIYRDRDHILGDPINATPAYVRAPVFNFQDTVSPLYSAFKTANATRQGVLYIAANDGMVHAFNGEDTPNAVATSAASAAGGTELWAYMPRMIFPNVHKLATDTWDIHHKFLVDGSPQVMDAFETTTPATTSAVASGAWKTILVGGLNKGGRGFYALDVTDPVTPKGLWEICADSNLCATSDADIGYSYGNAIITKLPNLAAHGANAGKWVAIFTSGINNYEGGLGDGLGYLYVRDLFTGAAIYKVGTGAGSTTTPAGLSKISAFADNFNNDNTATFIYGGDLLGNLWRFDMSTNPPHVLKLAELKDAAAGRPQSITSRPELGVIDSKRVVFVGTGRYLGVDDLVDPATISLPWAYQQSIYAIKDAFASGASAGHGDIRGLAAPNNLVQQTLTDNGTSRTTSNNTVNWTNNVGWYVDLNPGSTSPGERVNLDPQLVLGTLVVVANVPNNNSCTVGGDSFIYQFNYASGSYVASSPGQQVAQKFTGQITVGLVVVRLPSGVFKGIATGATGTKTPVGVNVGGTGGSGRRVSYREVIK